MTERALAFDALMLRLPVEYAQRWCEPGPQGCACMGCVNGPEAGAGNAAALGYTKADWENWWNERCRALAR